MSVLDIRPTREYWEMKKRIKNMTTNKTVAIATINEMGNFNKRGAKNVAKWLRQTADTVENDYKLWTKKKAVFKYIIK